MTNDIREKVREEFRTRKLKLLMEQFGLNRSDAIEIVMHEEMDIAEARESMRQECLAALPQEVDTEERGGEMPEDPSIAADQARNYTIEQIRTAIESLSHRKEESNPH